MAAIRSVVIVSAARTPIGSFSGSLASLKAPELGAAAIKAAVSRAGISSADVNECLMGNVCSAGVGQAPARQAALKAGLSESTVCTTINKVCSSGMKSVMLGAQSIMLGQSDVVVAGGMESMSNIPHYLSNSRTGTRLGHGTFKDGMILDGLWDPFGDQHMGNIAEACAKKFDFSREAQDDYAVESYRRAQEAHENGCFDAEIEAVSIPQRRGDPVVVSDDEEYTKFNAAKFRTLNPAFEKNGTVTAGNASKLNDGGCALVLMAEEEAQKRGLTPLARIRGFGDAELPPIDFPIAPSSAVKVALKHAGVEMSDVSYFETNEAFSVVSLANNKLLGLNPENVNVWGGAVALGHPIGCSGARILTTLTSVLKAKDAGLGVAAICNGGGGGSAVVIERV